MSKDKTNTELTIAVVQHVSTPGNINASLDRFAQYAKKAKEAGASLLIFPEASLTGYNNTLEVNQRIAVEAQSDTTNTIADICQQNNIAIAYGFAERANDKLFNSMQFINADGTIATIYRKTHLWGEQDRTLFSEGEDLTAVFDWNGWKIGLLICYDIEFPENVRRLTLEGAEFIITPTALMSPWSTVADKVVPVRAYENQVFIAYANFCGSEYEQHYVGHSCIVGPDGIELAKAHDDETMLVATLSKSEIKEHSSNLPYLRDRRPALYKKLIE